MEKYSDEIIEDKVCDEERALYGKKKLEIRKCSFDGPQDGESAIKECSDILAENCYFNLRYPFWHDKNVKVRNSILKGEYLAWYCENVTFENCRIIGTQPFCYCKGLRLINCSMLDTDLCFEKSQVEATITTPVVSIKNPYSGHIYVPAAGEIIVDDDKAKGEVVFTRD